MRDSQSQLTAWCFYFIHGWHWTVDTFRQCGTVRFLLYDTLCLFKKTLKRHHHPQVTTIAALSQAMASIKKTYVRIICRHSKIVRPPFFLHENCFAYIPSWSLCWPSALKRKAHMIKAHTVLYYIPNDIENGFAWFFYFPPHIRAAKTPQARHFVR